MLSCIILAARGVTTPVADSPILTALTASAKAMFIFTIDIVARPILRSLGTTSKRAHGKGIEIRGLSETPVVVVANEREAAVYFPLLGGRIDYAGFVGDDPVFLGWAMELFLYYWDRGKQN